MNIIFTSVKRILLSVVLLAFLTSGAFADTPAGFSVYTVKRGDTWESVIPIKWDREFTRRVNRMNIELTTKKRINVKTILVPVDEIAFSYVPVPTQIPSDAVRELVFYKKEQYFGAYEHGRLVKWGPISTGRSGNTPVGSYKALYKQAKKYSSRYHNARMFFAVQFKGNFFSHEQVLPGHAASAGCIRMLWEDAEWKLSLIHI